VVLERKLVAEVSALVVGMKLVVVVNVLEGMRLVV
jgi:hypothetical protein